MFNYAPHHDALARAADGTADSGEFYLQYHQLQKAQVREGEFPPLPPLGTRARPLLSL